MARLNRIWRYNIISFASKLKLYKSLVTSILLCGCETWTLLVDWEKDSGLRNQVPEETSPHLQLGPTTGYGARSTPLLVHRNLFWQLWRDGNVRGSGMSHATTDSPKPFFKATWSVVDAVVGRGITGWTTSKSGYPCQCQKCSQGSSAEQKQKKKKLEEDLCWIVSHVPPTIQSIIGQGAGLNWCEGCVWIREFTSVVGEMVPFFKSC